MTMEVNRNQGVGADYPQTFGTRATKKADSELIFKNTNSEKMSLRKDKYSALQTIYTDKKEYKAALQKAKAEGTYNPDAPKFIYADSHTVKNYQELGRATGQQIVNDDGTINTYAYKYAMRLISGDMNIDKLELQYAKDTYNLSLSKSELKKLAKPLGIELTKASFVLPPAEAYSSVSAPVAELNTVKSNVHSNPQADEMAGLKLDSAFANKSKGFQIVYGEVRALATQKGLSNIELMKIIGEMEPDYGQTTLSDLMETLNLIKNMPDKE